MESGSRLERAKSLIRQILAESLLLSLAGGGAGLVLSFLGLRVFNVWAPFWLPKATGIFVDGRVLLFTVATCVTTGIAFGIVLAFRAVKSNVNECLREARITATVALVADIYQYVALHLVAICAA